MYAYTIRRVAAVTLEMRALSIIASGPSHRRVSLRKETGGRRALWRWASRELDLQIAPIMSEAIVLYHTGLIWYLVRILTEENERRGFGRGSGVLCQSRLHDLVETGVFPESDITAPGPLVTCTFPTSDHRSEHRTHHAEASWTLQRGCIPPLIATPGAHMCQWGLLPVSEELL